MCHLPLTCSIPPVHFALNKENTHMDLETSDTVYLSLDSLIRATYDGVVSRYEQIAVRNSFHLLFFQSQLWLLVFLTFPVIIS